MTHCKDCKHFERGKWHEAIGGGEQSGGNCPKLLTALKLYNTNIFFWENIYIPDIFGCVLGVEKEEEIHDCLDSIETE